MEASQQRPANSVSLGLDLGTDLEATTLGLSPWVGTSQDRAWAMGNAKVEKARRG